jgi:hypothetical protein
VSLSNWTVHSASQGNLHVECVRPDTFGGRERFAYALTRTVELLNHEDTMMAIRLGKPIPTVRRVAIRRTFAEIERLAKKWNKEPIPPTRSRDPLVSLAEEAMSTP